MHDGKYVILCIDDDEDILVSLRLVLEGNGYIVHGAATAEEGLRIYKKTKPDLLIVDLMMEEVDAGTRFVTSLKALGNVAPVFMLSSVGDSLSRHVDYSDLGLAGVFQKPIDPHTLLTTVKKRLEKK